MAFSDQPAPSLLRLWPLVPLGRAATRLIHRAQGTADGAMLSARHYIAEDVAWRLGQAYIGALGLLALPLTWWYLKEFHRGTGRIQHYVNVFGRPAERHYLGFWSDLPGDLKIILPLTFVLHIIGMVSAMRCILVRQELQVRDQTT
jgi:hypothetical protein